MKVAPSHTYTLASRTSRPANQNLPKSMAAQTHIETTDEKHKKHNNAYKSLGNRQLN
ncbi:hypothetical protein MNBD_BACTEROID01-2060 [hydrothermal vent metagenome]|uniref:Uncharacterized protein n=1 Tax=hydrothermal vent metagenome TaxID=652676 RepID=A0A3B0U2Y1_9ZZZZ